MKKALTEDEAYIGDLAIVCSFMDEHDAESAYSKPSLAVHDSGVKSTALVRLMALDQNDFTKSESAFLVADFVEGSCLVDLVHPWDLPSTIADTTFATVWKPMPQGYRVEVRSRQALHESLDSEELEAGESDVRSDYCTRITYDVTGGRFRPVSRDSTEARAATIDVTRGEGRQPEREQIPCRGCPRRVSLAVQRRRPAELCV